MCALFAAAYPDAIFERHTEAPPSDAAPAASDGAPEPDDAEREDCPARDGDLGTRRTR